MTKGESTETDEAVWMQWTVYCQSCGTTPSKAVRSLSSSSPDVPERLRILRRVPGASSLWLGTTVVTVVSGVFF